MWFKGDCRETFDAAKKEIGINHEASGRIGVETHCIGAKSLMP
jgi:hypothetical protein